MNDQDGMLAKCTERPLSQRIRPIVLVVEDNEDDFFLLHRVFKKVGNGAEISRLESGTDALKYFGDAKDAPALVPALLLLDLKLPGASGFEVLKSVRSDRRFATVTVNILSSSAEPADIHRAYMLGANAYTVKPMSLSQYEEVMGGLFNFWFKLSSLPISSHG